MRLDRRILYNRWKMNLYFDLQNITFAENATGYDYGDRYQNIAHPKKVTGVPFMPFFGLEMMF